MIIDFHMHERTFSSDSRMNLIEMVEEAKRVGLDGICITDHDEFGLTEYAKEISEAMDFPIFVGIEYLSLEGDILAFGIPSLPPKRHGSAQWFIDWVKEHGGITIAAHPFRSNSRGLGKKLLTVKDLDGVEVLNGSTSPHANQKAREYAEKIGVKCIGASDCHNLIALGRYATFVDYDCKTVDDLVYAVKNCTCYPVILSGYKKFQF